MSDLLRQPSELPQNPQPTPEPELVQHSGKLPAGLGGEFPDIDYSKSLDDAIRDEDVTGVDKHGRIKAAQPEVIESTPRNPLRRFLSTIGGKITVAGAGLALAGSAAAGIGNAINDAPEKPQTTAAAEPSTRPSQPVTPPAAPEVTPSTIPTTTPSPEVTPTTPEVKTGQSWTSFEIPKETVDAMLALTDEEFKQLPPSQRVLVPLYFAQQIDIVDESKKNFSAVTQNPIDNVPSSLTEESSAQDIISFDTGLGRIIPQIEDPNNPGSIDVNASKKVVLGAATDYEKKGSYLGIYNWIDTFAAENNGKTMSTIDLVGHGFFATQEVISSTPKTIDEEGRLSITITVKGRSEGTDGQVETGTWVWMPLSDTTGIWIQA